MLTTQERKQRYWGVLITLGAIIITFMLNLGISIPFLDCPLLRYTGIPCPAWGLTRSLMATGMGDLETAIAYHVFGPFLGVAFLGIGLHLSLELLTNQKIPCFYQKRIQNIKVQLFFFLLLFSYHGVRLIEFGRSGELYPSFLASPLGNWLWGG